jgi:sugar-specific transcriptional regulator TrmB
MREDALRALGLRDKEISVYLACLQLGPSLAQEIASLSKTNRTSAYDLLDSLERQGFVGHVVSGGRRLYQAVEPMKLLDLLKEKEIMVQEALPSLSALAKSIVKKPNIEVFVGVKGVRSIFQDVLHNAKEVDTISSMKPALRLFKYSFPHFVKERVRRKIRVRLIIDKKPIDQHANYRLIKRTPKMLVWLYSDRIAMISLEEKEPVGVLIHEKNFYETQKMLFDLLWESLPEPRLSSGRNARKGRSRTARNA